MLGCADFLDLLLCEGELKMLGVTMKISGMWHFSVHAYQTVLYGGLENNVVGNMVFLVNTYVHIDEHINLFLLWVGRVGFATLGNIYRGCVSVLVDAVTGEQGHYWSYAIRFC